MGGARQDEEKAEPKKDFSHRDEFGQWDPKIKDQNCGIYLRKKKLRRTL